MSFWTESALEPKRNFRFKITKDGWGDQPVWYWAKSVDKPSFEVSNNAYQLINHKFNYPGIVTWKPISLVVVDIKDLDGNDVGITHKLSEELLTIGYANPSANSAMRGIAKLNESKVANLVIEQLDADGKSLEEWTLKGAFITSVSHSKLAYTDDEITETTIEITYDYAELF